MFLALFVFCICFAIVSDVRRLTIPNWTCLTLAAGFFAFALLARPDLPLLPHVLTGLALFVIGSAFFLLNWLGGGDVKLLAAAALWAGPEHIVPLTLMMSVSGALLAAAILAIRSTLKDKPEATFERRAFSPVIGWARRGVCPYGAAIGLAALLSVPRLFM